MEKTSDTIIDVVPKPFYLQPKLHLGFGNFNFRGDISDTRKMYNRQSGFQIDYLLISTTT